MTTWLWLALIAYALGVLTVARWLLRGAEIEASPAMSLLVALVFGASWPVCAAIWALEGAAAVIIAVLTADGPRARRRRQLERARRRVEELERELDVG